MRIKFPDMPEKYVFLFYFIILNSVPCFMSFSWFVSSKSITYDMMYETLVSPRNSSQTKIILNSI